MKKKHKVYLKLNLMSLFFVAVSFISITLAWFAYSGLITTKTKINVKAWYVEFNKSGQAVSNEIVISLDDIHPGMETISEKIDIKNLGDTAAAISYEIKSARILDETLTETNQDLLKGMLSHDYPFHIDMSLSNNYAHANDGVSDFTIAVSWPFESDNDSLDSLWGTKAYNFAQDEKKNSEKNENYDPRTSIKIEISLKAVQYIDELDAIDHNFRLGNIVLYDVVKNEKCNSISNTCLKTYVIDKDNRLSDTNVILLPDLYSTYTKGTYNDFNSKLTELTTNWTVSNRPVKVEDLVSIISNNVLDSIIMRPKLSNETIGYLRTPERITQSINKVTSYNGQYRFTSTNYPYLATTKCYWLDTEYSAEKQFAIQKIDDTYSKIYGELKTNECHIVPVLEVSKNKLK